MIEVINEYDTSYLKKSLKSTVSLYPKLIEYAISIKRKGSDRKLAPAIMKVTEKFLACKTTPIFRHVYIETINRCNGGCNFCHANKDVNKKTLLLMKENTFEKIIKELKDINFKGWISLHMNNEPFLDKRLIDLVKKAKLIFPDTLINIHTNGTLLDINTIRQIMPYISFLQINNYNDSLQLHSQIREIVDYCNRTNEFDGKITVSIRKENEILLNKASSAPNRKSGYTLTSPCLYPFEQICVTSSGNVILCCNDAFEKVCLGDVSTQSLTEIWNGESFKDIRNKMVQGRQFINICSKCDVLTPPKSF